MRTSRRRSSNPKRARSSRLAKASEAKLELNEKNFIFRSDELQKKYLGSDSRYGSDVAVQIGGRRTMMPSIFGESLFDRDPDDWFDFRMTQLPDVDKALYGRHAKNMMKTDVRENGNKYEVSVDLPGFDKDNVKVELKDGYLTISAEKDLDKEDKNEDKKYLRKERYEGSMSRSFYVGDEITQDDINANYKNGVLTLELPKKDQKKVEADTSHMIEVH